jgi:hypothetical protein
MPASGPIPSGRKEGMEEERKGRRVGGREGRKKK